ncbi:alpha/beta hydrolase [Pyxidicoccus fallax]|uniref:Alpha/beta hydrolase n=1 Tax=Pyxidicoccus fallax TaxID=394095 RepID=A0A848LN91_9BACT|nr:alpha/beta hydrolase [Pyxidicoccus fallax]NMO19083.1 alpha/beta hydrolase [Pyxidicoccus fallax]NPC79640.1 alpha/beta hydrolase [Pyxidicoccus fallax]
MKHDYADVNGIRMHYVAAGEGEPILFLHGFPEFWGVWKKVMADLSKDFRVIAPDLRGINLTSRPERVEDYAIPHLVADVRALVKHLGDTPVTLVCQDWGALLGWSYLLRHPDTVKRFVAINVTHPALFLRDLRENPRQQEASQYMLAFRTPGSENMLMANDFAFGRQALFADARSRGADISEEDINEWVAAWRQPGALKAGLDYYRAARLGPPDGQGNPGGGTLVDGLTPEQLQVKAPVLVLWGEQDPYLLQDGLVGLEQYVRDFSVQKFPESGHSVTMERPKEVARAVRDFMAAKR